MKSIIRQLQDQNEVVLASRIKKVLAAKTPDSWKKEYPQIKSRGWMNPEILEEKFPWFLEASVKNAEIDYDNSGRLIWNGGTWKNGWWYNGIWERGTWKNGTWEKGLWKTELGKTGTGKKDPGGGGDLEKRKYLQFRNKKV